MASGEDGKDIAKSGNSVSTPGRGTMSGYGQRAATALDRLVPGPHRDKLVARLFGVSPRMAQHLRRGRFWTVDRLTQASQALGSAFDRMLVSSDEWDRTEMQDIAERLARLEAWRGGMEQVDRGGDAGLAPAAGAALEPEGREAMSQDRVRRDG